MVIFNQIKLFCSLCYFINSAICYYDDPNHEIFTCFCRGNLDFVSSVSCSTICYYDDPNHEIFTCFCRGNLDLCYFVSSVSCSTILPIETSSPVWESPTRSGSFDLDGFITPEFRSASLFLISWFCLPKEFCQKSTMRRDQWW